MYEEFKALAYRKAIWEKVGKVLRDYFPEDLDMEYASKQDVILCDEVPFKDRRVPREAIEDVLEEVAGIVKEAESSLSSFEIRKKSDEKRTVRKKAPSVRSSSKSTGRKTRTSRKDTGQ